jgi:hypothetical protein
MKCNSLTQFLLVAAFAAASGFCFSEGLNQSAKSVPPAPSTANVWDVLTVRNSNGKVVASVFNSTVTGEKLVCMPSDVPAYDQTCGPINNFKPAEQSIARALLDLAK